MAIPTGLPCFLSTLPCFSSSSQVFGYSRPAFLKWAMLYVAGKEIQNQGTARQPDLVWPDSAAKGYQPPYFFPRSSTTSPTSASWLSKMNGSAPPVRSRSWPDCAAASAARLAGNWRCAIVSTRTVTPACLPKASACLRSSSSEAGTKWFQERNVSSRFCANAGAAPARARRSFRRSRPRWFRETDDGTPSEVGSCPFEGSLTVVSVGIRSDSNGCGIGRS